MAFTRSHPKKLTEVFGAALGRGLILAAVAGSLSAPAMAAECSDADLSLSQYDKIQIGLPKSDLLSLYPCAADVSTYTDTASRMHEVLTWTSGERSISVSVDLVDSNVLTKNAYGLKPLAPITRAVREGETKAKNQSWVAGAGDSFRYTVLKKWAGRSGWSVVWDASLEDIELRAAFVTSGDIVDALTSLMDSLPADVALRISMYRPNAIIYVHNPGL